LSSLLSVSLSDEACNLLKSAVEENPGLTLGKLAKLYPELKTQIVSLAKTHKLSPLDLIRQRSDVVTIHKSGSFNVLYPASYKPPSSSAAATSTSDSSETDLQFVSLPSSRASSSSSSSSAFPSLSNSRESEHQFQEVNHVANLNYEVTKLFQEGKMETAMELFDYLRSRHQANIRCYNVAIHNLAALGVIRAKKAKSGSTGSNDIAGKVAGTKLRERDEGKSKVEDDGVGEDSVDMQEDDYSSTTRSSSNNIIDYEEGTIGGIDVMEKVEELFEEMKQRDEATLRPNYYTYGTLINAWAQRNNDKRVLQLLQEMSDNGIAPQLATMDPVLRLFAKRGFLSSYLFLSNLSLLLIDN